MCIDATRKLEEESRFSLEKVDDGTLRIGIISGSKEEVKQWGDSLKQLISISYPEIVDLNTTWVELGISVVFISVKKNRRNHIRELNDKLFLTTTLNEVKFIIYVEHSVDANDTADVIWRWSNNLDPRRDSYVVAAPDNENISHIGFDGTRKTKEYDDFDREWPNIICMNEATIKTIDEKWSSLNLGPFLPSPSLKHRNQLYKGGAVAID